MLLRRGSIFPVFVVLLLVSMSCSRAKFSGNSYPTNQDNRPHLSCSVFPETIKPNETIKIAVTANPLFTGRIIQNIKKSGNSLKAIEGEYKKDIGFVRADQKANEESISESGEYLVELSIKDNSDPANVATCKFNVTALPTPPPPACQNQEILLGAKVVFMIDNSSSNAYTDCPNRQTMQAVSGSQVFQCNAAPKRYTAVLDAVADIYEKSKVTSKENPSSVASIVFPNTRNLNVQWTNIDENSKNKMAQELGVLKTPYGLTPFEEGIANAEKLFSQIQSSTAQESAKLLIVVTDGFPTDRNPVGTLNRAEALKKSGVEIVSIPIGTKSLERQAYVNDIIQFSTRIAMQGQTSWWSDDSLKLFGNDRDSLNKYIDFSIGSLDQKSPSLLEKMSSRVEKVCDGDANAANCNLSSIFKEIIRKKMISCPQQ